FDVVSGADGRTVIRVNSRDPIVEPCLNFVIEVIWPSGRLVREYTVLLDPPVLTTSSVRKVQWPQATTRDEDNEQLQRLSQSAEQVNPWQTMTGAGDTLWQIASRIRPDKSVSVQQIMLALQRANPDAFIADNINRLKAGYRLELPDLNAIEASSQAEAIREVALQNDRYNESQLARGDRTLGNQKKNQSSLAPKESEESEAELRLVSSQDAVAAAENPQENVQAAKMALAIAEEDLDLSQRENTALSNRLDQLENEMMDLGALVKLKDQQLAALQNQLAEFEQNRSDPVDQPASMGLLGNLYIQMALAGLLVLLVVLAMLYARNRRKREDDGIDAAASQEQPPAQSAVHSLDSDAAETAQEVDEASTEEPPLGSDLDDLTEPETVQEQDSDLDEPKDQAEDNAPALEYELDMDPSLTQTDDEVVEIDDEVMETDDEITETDDAVDTMEATAESDAVAEDDESEQAGLSGEEVDVVFKEDPPLGLDNVADSEAPVASLEDDLSEDEIDLDLELDIDLDTELEIDEANDDLTELDLEAELDQLASDGKQTDAEADAAVEPAEPDLDEALEELDLDGDSGNKLDLARAYLEMGDEAGAVKLLRQVVKQGLQSEVDEAEQMLAELKQE
ncbi:MAG: FimV/HubP family polar landmark protein, partial [Pseudomonadota bacterium]|nr:FimV/HubP family polar landmark protein [Pseudomonadota bacterium]